MTTTNQNWGFGPTTPPPTPDPDKRDELIVEIWSKAVDTQMHFNEMSVKSRQLGLTFVAAALGLAIFFLLRNDPSAVYTLSVQLGQWKPRLHVAEFITLAAAVAVFAVRRLDLGVYHKMLRGAVTFGEDLETNHLLKIIPLRKGMTQAISHYSRYEDATVTATEDGKYLYSGSKRLSAYDKIASFYFWVISALCGITAVIFLIDNLRV